MLQDAASGGASKCSKETGRWGGTAENKEKRTARPLVEVDKTASQANEATKSHGLCKAAFADVGWRESLHGQEQARPSRRRNRAVCVVGWPGIPHHPLEVSRQGGTSAIEPCSSTKRCAIKQLL